MRCFNKDNKTMKGWGRAYDPMELSNMRLESYRLVAFGTLLELLQHMHAGNGSGYTLHLTTLSALCASSN
jgi:hypothetical protein